MFMVGLLHFLILIYNNLFISNVENMFVPEILPTLLSPIRLRNIFKFKIYDQAFRLLEVNVGDDSRPAFQKLLNLSCNLQLYFSKHYDFFFQILVVT
jgi:hypothetical protein